MKLLELIFYIFLPGLAIAFYLWIWGLWEKRKKRRMLEFHGEVEKLLHGVSLEDRVKLLKERSNHD